MSVKVKQTPDAAHDLHAAFHDMRQPVATKNLAHIGTVMHNPSAVAGPSIERGLGLSAAAKSVVKHGE